MNQEFELVVIDEEIEDIIPLDAKDEFAAAEILAERYPMYVGRVVEINNLTDDVVTNIILKPAGGNS